MINLFIKIKEKIYNIWKYLKNPIKLVCDICEYDNRRYAHLISDKMHLKCLFRKYMGTKLNLSNPKTFNEKLQWLKLYDRKPEYTVMADKEAVKEYIAKELGEEFIIPTIGLYDSVDDIPFDELPQKFVIKCTHDSGSIFICDKNAGIDINFIKNELSQKLQTNHFWYSREWVYKDIRPRIIIEDFLPDENGNSPVDYKFFCFDGKMEVFKIDYDRFGNHISNYYTKDSDYLNFHEKKFLSNPRIKPHLPSNFIKMISIAEKLSEGISFLRVDLYCVGEKIYFGELTFYPHSGLMQYTDDGDFILGKLLKLRK